ncbi:hypothetical protein [Gemmatimonas sp.]|uniref:hypothetical protein n=1 Tax=Gemmatimonas sp. TaxID=1962908 RepID=UPI0037BE843C
MTEPSTLVRHERSRFRGTDEWFVVVRQPELVAIRVFATAERIVDCWHALSLHLDPAVDVHIPDLRSSRRWSGGLLALPDVREAMGRLRLPLAACGGVELSLFTDSDQLTLTPEMLLVIYAHTDRWTYLLDGLGLLERPDMAVPVWLPTRDLLRPDTQFAHALHAAADRRRLTETAL